MIIPELPKEFEKEIEAYIEWDHRFFKIIRGAINQIEEEKKTKKHKSPK